MFNSLRNKLLVITGIGTLLAMASGFVGLVRVIDSHQRVVTAIETDLSLGLETEGLAGDFNDQVQEWKDILLRGSDEKARTHYWDAFKQKHQAIQTHLEQMLSRSRHAEMQQMIRDFKTDHAALLAKYQKGYQAYIDAGFDAKAGDNAVKGIDREPTEALEKMSVVIKQLVEQAVTEAETDIRSIVKQILVLVSVSVILAFVLFLWVVRKNIENPAASLANNLALMAEGDFTHTIEVTSRDEIGRIADSVRHLQKDFRSIVESINNAAFRLSTSAEERAHLTEQSNQAMMQQRNETDQVATAMNEMTATVHEVAQNAQLAAQSASEANSEVNNGQTVVNESIRAIGSLVQRVEHASDVIHTVETNSQEIGSVLDVIRSIAEQTNLLALNAAIEAARAGEQGRGFAVVADEVRVLAQRTQSSTEEIQAMIERLQSGTQEAVDSMNQSRSQADTTRDTAAKAGEVLNRITGSVNNINDMNTLIASAAEEQNAVAEEINRNIVGISQAAEHTSDTANQTASTSEELRTVAEELKHVVSRLKI